MSIRGEYSTGDERSRADLIRGIDRAIYTADRHRVRGSINFGFGTDHYTSMGIEASSLADNPENHGEMTFIVKSNPRSQFTATLIIEQDAVRQAVQDMMDGMIQTVPLNGMDLRKLPDFRSLMLPGVDQTHDAEEILRWMLGGLRTSGSLSVTGHHTDVKGQRFTHQYVNFAKNYAPTLEDGRAPITDKQARSTVVADRVPPLYIPENPDVPIGSDHWDGIDQGEAISRLWSYVDAVRLKNG